MQNTITIGTKLKRLLSDQIHASGFVLHVSERRLLLTVIDLLLLNVILFLTVTMRAMYSITLAEVWERLPWFLVLSTFWLIMAQLLDVYDLGRAANGRRSFWTGGGAALITTTLYLFIPYFTPSFPARRLDAFLFPIAATLAIATWRFVYARVFVHTGFIQQGLVVGAGDSGHTLAKLLAKEKNLDNLPDNMGYRLIGFIDDDPAKSNLQVHDVPVVGTCHDLVGLAREHQPNEIVVAITTHQVIQPELFEAIVQCREMGIPITTMTALYERLTGRVPVEHAGRNLYVVMPLDQPASHRPYMLARRLLDMLVALVGCVVLALVTPFIWLGNLFSSPGPLFYRQERVGLAGQSFQIIKFRSMIVNAEKSTGAVWAEENDPRITRMGRFLRKSRLDELPQFWNVLKGEMSLIGPRPERPQFVEQLTKDIPFYRVRHAVRPGITGWAQAKYRYGASVDDALIKLQHDLYYIKHQSPYLDLLILLKTVPVVLGVQGR